MANVSNLVKSIQDIMRKDAGTYGDAERLEQLGWMFFLKIFDDREKQLALLRDNYKSPLPSQTTCRGTYLAGPPGRVRSAVSILGSCELPKRRSGPPRLFT